jgi:hypothetical protein
MKDLVDVCPPYAGEKIRVFKETESGSEEIEFRRLKKGDRFKAIEPDGNVKGYIAASNPLCGSLAEALDPMHSWSILVDEWKF